MFEIGNTDNVICRKLSLAKLICFRQTDRETTFLKISVDNPISLLSLFKSDDKR